jgi:hypothetical protein
MTDHKDRFDLALSELGRTIGMPGITFDDKNFCHLEIDDRRLIIIQRDAPNNRLLFLAHVANDLPENLPAEMWNEIFAPSAAENREYEIAYVAEEKFVLIHRSLPIDGLTGQDLFEAFGKMLELQLKWVTRFEEEFAKAPIGKPSIDLAHANQFTKA